MSSYKKLVKKLPKHTLATIAILLTLLFGIFGVYTTFFYTKNPSLRYEIISNTPVLDVKEDIGKLDILYDGKSIKTTDQTLTILTVKVKNDGTGSILLNYFDKRTPLGIFITEGAIVENVELLAASNTYLREGVVIKTLKNQITFSEFILDPDDFFTIKILVLHKRGIETSIESLGKVATIKEIKVIKYEFERDNRTFWQKPFGVELSIALAVVMIIAIYFVTIVINTIMKVLSATINVLVISHFTEKYRDKPLPVDDVIRDSFNKHKEKIIYDLNDSIDSNDFIDFKEKYPETFERLVEVGAISMKGEKAIMTVSSAERIRKFNDYLANAAKEVFDETE